MSQANLDLGIFQYTNLNGGFYTHRLARYSVVAMDAPIRHCSRVAVFYRLSLCYATEAIQQFIPNDVGFHMTTGKRQWVSLDITFPPTTPIR